MSHPNVGQGGEDSDIEVIDTDEIVQVPAVKSDKRTSDGARLWDPFTRFLKMEAFQVGDKVYGLERSLKDPWREAIIESIDTHFGRQVVRLKFLPGEKIANRRKVTEERIVHSKHIAYYEQTSHVIPVGCRVVARTQDKTVTGNFFFAGIVAEPPKETNKNRYLIFFDDGLAAYCDIDNVRLTLTNTPPGKIWSDVHPDMQRFIRQYVIDYPQNNMAKIRVSALTTVEWNGVWWAARVKEIDGSLVKVQLPTNKIVLTIWRGSARFLSIFKEQKLFKHVSYPLHIPEEYEGKIVKHRIPEKFKVKRMDFKPEGHTCTGVCWGTFPGNSSELRHLSPLVVPYYYGWDRKIDPDDPRRKIYYQSPCGKKVYTLEGIQDFITKLKCPMAIDCFCFDFAVQCLDEFQMLKKPNYEVEDISYGLEWIPISKVNAVDDVEPQYIAYTNQRVYGHGVKVQTDQEFLVCCDCVDDCTDKLKCACIRLTFENEPEFCKHPEKFNKGYQHRRLMEKLILGIYECNTNCKCRATCVNRVVQNGIRWRLQVFKTAAKGFAIRTLQDIPEGSFICVYTGELLSSKQANEFGGKFGDEYLANIDFIEFAEKYKEGYEEDVVEPEYEPVRSGRKSDAKSDKVNKKSTNKRGKRGTEGENVKSGSQKGKCKRKRIIEEPSEDEESAKSDGDDEDEASKTRKLFGPDEDDEIFTIDAKCIGNIGRYLNHSCDPNVFAQDVFLDTHDIRFPWVAFFANRYLKCGTELTWDYNYEIGMAEGKFVACNCGSIYCRKRLL